MRNSCVVLAMVLMLGGCVSPSAPSAPSPSAEPERRGVPVQDVLEDIRFRLQGGGYAARELVVDPSLGAASLRIESVATPEASSTNETFLFVYLYNVPRAARFTSGAYYEVRPRADGRPDVSEGRGAVRPDADRPLRVVVYTSLPDVRFVVDFANASGPAVDVSLAPESTSSARFREEVPVVMATANHGGVRKDVRMRWNVSQDIREDAFVHAWWSYRSPEVGWSSYRESYRCEIREPNGSSGSYTQTPAEQSGVRTGTSHVRFAGCEAFAGGPTGGFAFAREIEESSVSPSRGSVRMSWVQIPLP